MSTDATIPAWFCRQVAERRDATAILVPGEDGYRGVSWGELGQDSFRLAAGLRSIGVGPGDRVVQIGANSYGWIAADIAILLARAVHVPVHASLARSQMEYQIHHSGAKVVILAGRAQADALAPLADSLTGKSRFYAQATWPDFEQHPLRIHPLEKLMEPQSEQGKLPVAAANTIDEGDLATIMYTSGTTGEPKGVMLSHGNLASNAAAAAELHGDESAARMLCFLPLSHIYARTCDMYTWIYRGNELALAENRDTIVANCSELRPTMINGVPYFYEKLCRRLRESGQADQPGVLRHVLGGNIRVCMSGGAALPNHVAEFFDRQGVLLVQGYGLTETSPVITAATPEANKLGTVGRPIPNVEVGIADDGEILTRGPHVMLGYWQDPEATAAAIRDGWLHTGDLGALDDDGFLTITGRKKELIVTAAGKNIVPSYLEGLLTASPFIAQAMLVGEGRNFLTALIVPDPESLRMELENRGIAISSREEIFTHPAVLEFYRSEIDRLLSDVARHEQVGQFALLDRALTIEAGELTPKGSLRRETIHEHFSDKIEAMY